MPRHAHDGMNRCLLALLLCALSVASPPRLAFACQCSPETADAALKRARVIVEGTVVRELPSATGESQTVVDLKEVTTHRGEPVGATFSVKNGQICSRSVVEPGKRYVIYMAAKDSLVSACSRVVERTALDPAEIAAFGAPGNAPASAEPPSPPTPGTAAPNSVPPPIEVDSSAPASERAVRGGGCASCSVEPEPAAPAAPAIGTLMALAFVAWRRRADAR